MPGLFVISYETPAASPERRAARNQLRAPSDELRALNYIQPHSTTFNNIQHRSEQLLFESNFKRGILLKLSQ